MSVSVNFYCGTKQMFASHGTGCVIEVGLYSSDMVIPWPGLRWLLLLASCIIYCSHKNH